MNIESSQQIVQHRDTFAPELSEIIESAHQHTSHEGGDFISEFLAIMTDPPHLAAEVVFEVGAGLLFLYFGMALERWRERKKHNHSHYNQ